MAETMARLDLLATKLSRQEYRTSAHQCMYRRTKVYLGFELIRLIASHRKLHQPRFRLRLNRCFTNIKHFFSVCYRTRETQIPCTAIDFIESHNVGDQHIYVIGIQSNPIERNR